ncbi:MAG: penicillin-binding protein 1C [Acidobacteria bacterium]|nr:penicillin-binding protein 1C [Acidobacteriota bacterium]
MNVRGRFARIGAAGLLAGGFFLGSWMRFGPVPKIDAAQFTSTVIVDRRGEVISEPLSPVATRSAWLTKIPANVQRATIAAEDRRYFHHGPVELRSIARALYWNVRSHHTVQGGSTITQQVAKMLLRSPDRSLPAKLREAVYAYRLQAHHTKAEILALYLNLAPYGNQIHGIARASRAYFGCEPEDLTIAQAAFLASLPQRPSAFNPLRDEKAAVARQRRVLAMMDLPTNERRAALDERLRFVRGRQPMLAQHFIERVRQTASGSRIETTLDAKLQRQVAGIISAQRDNLLRHGAHSVAVAVLDNATGEWLAWEGSGDYFGDNFGGAIDGVSALRQPGSTLKPFTYALAFENGFTPASVLPDVESHFPTAQEGVVYTPRNYDGRFRGPLRARAALAGSENVPAVALLSKLGTASLLRLLHDAGFRDLDKTADYYGLGLTLGDAEVRLEQLVAAYAMLARGGVYREPTMLRGQHPAAQPRRVLSERTAFWLTDILSDSSAREYIFGTGGSLDFPFPVAVKTGTSQAYRDNWTVGYTKDVTVGVWVGNFDRIELRNSTGVTGAGPIFNAVMLAAARPSTQPPTPPPSLARRPICALSGLRPSPSCPALEDEWIPLDAPAQFCSWHHQDWIDYPPEYRAWAKTQVASAPPTRHPTALKVTSPPNGATYLIDPTLRSEFQAVYLRATSTTPLTWHVDDRRLGSTPPDGSLEWPLKPGYHTVTATDTRGNRDSVQIYVK